MYFCVLMRWGIPLILHCSTDAYAARQGNDHYVYHNVAVMVTIPNRYSTSIATKECSPDQKGGPEVCEPTGGSIVARVDHV